MGRHAIIGGYSVVTQDVMPFSNTVSERGIKVFGANRIGLERRGFDRATIEALQTAFRLLTRAGLNTTQAVERIRAEVPESRARWRNCWRSSATSEARSDQVMPRG